MAYRLTAKAEEDVIRIYAEGARLFGPEIAEDYHHELISVFDMMAQTPKLARERPEITPPVRIHPHKSHLIIYLVDDEGDVLIIRIRHGHEDWERDPF